MIGGILATKQTLYYNLCTPYHISSVTSIPHTYTMQWNCSIRDHNNQGCLYVHGTFNQGYYIPKKGLKVFTTTSAGFYFMIPNWA